MFDELTSVMEKLTYIRLVARGLARPVTKATRYKSCLTLINISGVGLHKAVSCQRV